MTVSRAGRIPVTAAEIAAILGVTPSAVRQIVRRNGVQPAGRNGRAKTYWFADIARHAGGKDRRDSCATR